MGRELLQLLAVKLRLAASSARSFLSESRLRAGVVCAAAAVFWLLMFSMFMNVFAFLTRFPAISDTVISYLFAFFFLTLLIMMAISNAIIAYTSFYRSDETSMLLSLPLRAESIFVYKGLEPVVFSAWGFGALVTPMVLAYGITFEASWQYYALSLLLAAVLVGLPLEIGTLAALLVPIVVPRRKRFLLLPVGLLALVLVVAWVRALVAGQPANVFSEFNIQRIMGQIAFCQHWALPSQWVSQGMILSAQGEWGVAVVHLLRLLANVLFLGVVTCRLGNLLYLRSWSLAHRGGGGGRRRKPRSLPYRIVEGALSPLPAKLRLLVLKDARTFLRDPVQWSQCLLFFGLLALYILNLPSLGISALRPYWHNLVSLLNLGATCLVLSMLTSRFVYPQLSLEGRRIWFIGLVPIRRSILLWGKFFFATGGTLLVSGGLIALGDLMLGLPGWTLLVHMVVVGCVCVGLSGLAVGLGAVYPQMRSDNPAKIVSSFGGTLNLILSICYIMICVIPVSVPLHLHATRALSGRRFVFWMLACLGADVVLAAIACLVPMKAGIRSFERMEF